MASILFGYGMYALIEANCTLIGRGNPPQGTFITFYGMEARLLSTIYIGAGVWMFAGKYLHKRHKRKLATSLSWLGAITLLFGLCVLVVILCLPLFT
ncbi:hypothetical protein [Kangiella sp. M94]